MDNISLTTQNSFTNYFNVVRRFGDMSQQDKYNLFVVWFFYYLKYKSDFLYDIDIPFNKEDYNAESELPYKWFIDRDLETFVNKKFKDQIACLTKDSCLIKVLYADECYPVPEKLWTEPIAKTLELLVSNNTNVDTNPIIFDNSSKKILVDQLGELYKELWSTNSSLMVENEYDEENVIVKNEKKYLTSNKNKYE